MPRKILIVAFVLALTLGVFSRTHGHHFLIWDDDKNIYENPYLTSDPVKYIPEDWKRPFQGLYIPVTYTVWSLLAHKADTRVNPGAGPAPIISAKRFHLANVIFHLASVGLVILLLYNILGRRDLFAAAIGASLFAFHPLQVEPVAWVTGLKDVLSCFLALICIFVYLRFAHELDDGERKRKSFAWIAYGGAILLYIVALLVKPQLVIVPPVLAIFLFILHRASLQTALQKYIPYAALGPFFLIALAFVIITKLSQPGQDMIFPYDIPSIPQRFIVALDALTYYLSKLVWPFGLTPEPGRNPAVALTLARNFPLWLIPVLLLVPLLRIRNHRPFYYGAIAIALVGVLPNLGFIPFAFQGQSTVADRYVYMAMIGLGLFLATYLTHTTSALPRYAAIAILPVMAFLAARQTALWKDTFSLYGHALKLNPQGVASPYNLGLAYQNDGFVAKAFDYYHLAIERREDFSRPYNNIGNGLNILGRYREAIPYLEKGIEADQSYGGLYMNIGVSYAGLGEHEKALAYFDKALEVQPMYPGCMVNVGVSLAALERPDEALQSFRRAIHFDPSIPQPYRGIADVKLAQGDYQGALDALHEALKLEPENPYSWKASAKAIAGLGDTANAVIAAGKALSYARASGQSPEFVRLLERDLEAYRKAAAPQTNPAPPSATAPLPPPESATASPPTAR